MTDRSSPPPAGDTARRRRLPPLAWIALALCAAVLLIAIVSGQNIQEVQGPRAGDPPAVAGNVSPPQPPDH
jgi:hypothetical protein